MEKMPEFEQSKSPEDEEIGLENRLVGLFKEKGLQAPEAKKLLIEWIKMQEAKRSNDSEVEIKSNLRRARLYLRIGLVDEAFENFEDAKTQAWNEHRDDLYEAIEKEVDEIKDSLGDR